MKFTYNNFLFTNQRLQAHLFEFTTKNKKLRRELIPQAANLPQIVNNKSYTLLSSGEIEIRIIDSLEVIAKEKIVPKTVNEIEFIDFFVHEDEIFIIINEHLHAFRLFDLNLVRSTFIGEILTVDKTIRYGNLFYFEDEHFNRHLIDLKTFNHLWKSKGEFFSSSVLEYDKKILLISGKYRDRIEILDLENGIPSNQYELENIFIDQNEIDGADLSIVETPFISDSILIAGLETNALFAFDLKKKALLWTKTVKSDYPTSFATFDEKVFFFDISKYHIWDLYTGQSLFERELKDEWKKSGFDKEKSRLILGLDNIFCLSFENGLVGEFNKKTGEIVNVLQLEEIAPSESFPLMTNNQIIVKDISNTLNIFF